MRKTVQNRPTESVAGVALAGTVIGLLVTNGVPAPIAAGVGIVVGFGPSVVSRFVDAVRG